MKDKQTSGFTLIEVISALLIICIIITGFSRVLCSSLQARRLSDDKNIITNWAQTVMEYVKTKQLEEIMGEHNMIDFPGLDDLQEDYGDIDKLLKKVEIIINKYNENIIDNNLYQISVIVKWEKESGVKTYKLSTLKYQEEDE